MNTTLKYGLHTNTLCVLNIIKSFHLLDQQIRLTMFQTKRPFPFGLKGIEG